MGQGTLHDKRGLGGIAVSWGTHHRRRITIIGTILIMIGAGVAVRIRVTAEPVIASVGAGPRAIAVDIPTHHVLVVNAGESYAVSGSVSILDAATGMVLRTTTVGHHPVDVAVDRRRTRAFVVNQGDNTVSVLDARSGRVVHTLAVGVTPNAVVVDEATGSVVVASGNGYGHNGRVTVFDEISGRVRHTIAVGDIPWAIALDGRTKHLFVSSIGDNSVTMIDTLKGRVVSRIKLGVQSLSLAVDTRRSRLFVLQPDANVVSVLDTRTGRLLRTVAVGVSPRHAVVDESAGRLFVINAGDDQRKIAGSVSVLETRNGGLIATITFGHLPYTAAVDERRGRVFIVGEDGTMVLDSRQGRRLRTVRPSGSLVAVNDATGAAFVVNTGLGGASMSPLEQVFSTIYALTHGQRTVSHPTGTITMIPASR